MGYMIYQNDRLEKAKKRVYKEFLDIFVRVLSKVCQIWTTLLVTRERAGAP